MNIHLRKFSLFTNQKQTNQLLQHPPLRIFYSTHTDRHMSMQICIHITLRSFQSNKCKITEGKNSLSTFIQTTSGKTPKRCSVAVLQF